MRPDSVNPLPVSVNTFFKSDLSSNSLKPGKQISKFCFETLFASELNK